MRVFVSIERHEPFRILAVADIANGWERNDRGYGSFGRGSIPYPGDRSLEITLNVRVRPYGNLSFVEFPTEFEQQGELLFDGEGGLGLYAVRNGKIGVLLAVGALQSDLEKSDGKPFYFEKIRLLRGEGRTRIQVNVSVAVCSTPVEPIGDIPEWNVQFWPAGLPSLGKRRP